MAQDQPVDRAGTPEAMGADDPAIVAFDFDGTLTIRDSFTAFLKWRAGPRRYALGMFRLAPAALAYVVNRDRGLIKAAAVREFLRGVPRAQLESEARLFAQQHSASLLRPDAVAAWNRWRSKPVRLVIVTASPDLIVAPFARALGAHTLLGTRLSFDAHDQVSGGFATPNCRGREKMVRLRAAFGPDVRIKAAYGDTSGDREMLQAAERPGYKVFKGTP